MKTLFVVLILAAVAISVNVDHSSEQRRDRLRASEDAAPVEQLIDPKIVALAEQQQRERFAKATVRQEAGLKKTDKPATTGSRGGGITADDDWEAPIVGKQAPQKRDTAPDSDDGIKDKNGKEPVRGPRSEEERKREPKIKRVDSGGDSGRESARKRDGQNFRKQREAQRKQQRESFYKNRKDKDDSDSDSDTDNEKDLNLEKRREVLQKRKPERAEKAGKSDSPRNRQEIRTKRHADVAARRQAIQKARAERLTKAQKGRSVAAGNDIASGGSIAKDGQGQGQAANGNGRLPVAAASSKLEMDADSTSFLELEDSLTEATFLTDLDADTEGESEASEAAVDADAGAGADSLSLSEADGSVGDTDSESVSDSSVSESQNAEEPSSTDKKREKHSKQKQQERKLKKEKKAHQVKQNAQRKEHSVKQHERKRKEADKKGGAKGDSAMQKKREHAHKQQQQERLKKKPKQQSANAANAVAQEDTGVAAAAAVDTADMVGKAHGGVHLETDNIADSNSNSNVDTNTNADAHTDSDSENASDTQTDSAANEDATLDTEAASQDNAVAEPESETDTETPVQRQKREIKSKRASPGIKSGLDDVETNKGSGKDKKTEAKRKESFYKRFAPQKPRRKLSEADRKSMPDKEREAATKKERREIKRKKSEDVADAQGDPDKAADAGKVKQKRGPNREVIMKRYAPKKTQKKTPASSGASAGAQDKKPKIDDKSEREIATKKIMATVQEKAGKAKAKAKKEEDSSEADATKFAAVDELSMGVEMEMQQCVLKPRSPDTDMFSGIVLASGVEQSQNGIDKMRLTVDGCNEDDCYVEWITAPVPTSDSDRAKSLVSALHRILLGSEQKCLSEKPSSVAEFIQQGSAVTLLEAGDDSASEMGQFTVKDQQGSEAWEISGNPTALENVHVNFGVTLDAFLNNDHLPSLFVDESARTALQNARAIGTSFLQVLPPSPQARSSNEELCIKAGVTLFMFQAQVLRGQDLEYQGTTKDAFNLFPKSTIEQFPCIADLASSQTAEETGSFLETAAANVAGSLNNIDAKTILSAKDALVSHLNGYNDPISDAILAVLSSHRVPQLGKVAATGAQSLLLELRVGEQSDHLRGMFHDAIRLADKTQRDALVQDILNHLTAASS